MAIYTLRTDGVDSQIEAETMEAARVRAREWIDEGAYDASGGTVYVDVYVIPLGEDGDEDRDSAERVTVSIHQPEPRCVADDGHDWQTPYELVGGNEENPGVWAKNGMGVVSNEACLRCGCRRRTDTGAERHDTGERPFVEVTYQPRHYQVPPWDREITPDDIAAAADAGACDQAIAWLEAEPRTVGDLSTHNQAWYEWAVRHLLTPARRSA